MTGQVAREALAEMPAADRLAAARDGRLEDVLGEAARARGQRISDLLGLDAEAVAGMTPEALLAAARANRAA